jgi:hypothetical protein
MKYFKHFAIAAVAALAVTFTACQKTNESVPMEGSVVTEATFSAITEVQERGGIGSNGCYELVFPITIQLPDATTAEVVSYESLKSVVRNYYVTNGVKVGKILNFVYPISVTNQDGEIVVIANENELKTLRADCIKQGGGIGTGGGHNGGGHPGGNGGGHQGGGNQGPKHCFEIVFPVTLKFPDNTTAVATTSADVKTLSQNWKKANPTVKGRPEIVFPITVVMTADSTTVVVASKEALKTLREDCK